MELQQPMSTNLARALRHPKERAYGGLMMVVGGLVWAVLLAVLVFAVVRGKPALLGAVVFYGVLLWIPSLIAAAFYRAYVFGHYVLLSDRQCAHLHQMVAAGAAELGLAKTPTAFVYNAHGVANAFARRVLGKPYIFLTSMLLDVDTDAQVRFVIGHELGHHAAGHLDWRVAALGRMRDTRQEPSLVMLPGGQGAPV